MLGLTDAHVAHMPMPPFEKRIMAHSKQATDDYIIRRGVDLVAQQVHLLTRDRAELARWHAAAWAMRPPPVRRVTAA
jgi:hypothetical protein